MTMKKECAFNFEENLKIRQQRLSYLSINKTIDEKTFIKPYNLYREMPTRELLEKYINVDCTQKENIILTTEQCLQDIAQLEFLISYFYAGYYPFGEDFFDTCFQKMRNEINKCKSINVEQFQAIINDSLVGIRDYHFAIHFKKTLRPFDNSMADKTFYNDKYNIIKRNSDYSISIGNKEHKIKKVNSKTPSKFIKTILTKNGDLKYALIEYCPANKYKDLTLTLDDGTKINIACAPVEYNYPSVQKELILTSLENNILYIRNQTLNKRLFGNHEESQAKLKPLEAIENAKCGIMDVCNNGGGSDDIVEKMMDKLGFSNNGYPINYFDLCARINESEKDKVIDEFIQKYERSIERNMPNIDRIKIAKPLEMITTSEKPLIILQDRNSCSAAEAFIELFYKHKSTIYIGDNTAGMMHFGNVKLYYLNSSGIQLRFGCSHFVNSGNKFLEGIGIEPDIYFPYEYEALVQATKKFISKNILK